MVVETRLCKQKQARIIHRFRNGLRSNVWREDVAHYFQALLKHLNEKYGDRIEAYLYAAGPTTE